MPMRNPAHLGEIVRECMESKGWTVTECAAQLGVSRITLSRLLNGRAASRPRWRWPWNAWAGATPTTGCGCKAATTWRRLGCGNGSPEAA